MIKGAAAGPLWSTIQMTSEPAVLASTMPGVSWSWVSMTIASSPGSSFFQSWVVAWSASSYRTGSGGGVLTGTATHGVDLAHAPLAMRERKAVLLPLPVLSPQ